MRRSLVVEPPLNVGSMSGNCLGGMVGLLQAVRAHDNLWQLLVGAGGALGHLVYHGPAVRQKTESRS